MGKFYPRPDLVAVGTARAPLWIWGTGIGLRWVGRPWRSGGRVRGWSKHEGVRHPGRGREGRGTGAGGSPRRRPRLRLKRGEHRPPGRARSGERSEAGCKARGRGGGGGRATEGGPEYVSRWLVPRRKAFYQRHCRKRIRTGDHDTQGVRKGRGREEPCRPPGHDRVGGHGGLTVLWGDSGGGKAAKARRGSRCSVAHCSSPAWPPPVPIPDGRPGPRGYLLGDDPCRRVEGKEKEGSVSHCCWAVGSMGGVKTGRVKGARLRKNPGTNVQLRGRGDSGCDSGGGWGAPPPDASASRILIGWGALGGVEKLGKTTVASNVGIHTAKGREGRGRTGSTRNKGRITDPRGKRGGQQRFEKHAKARQVHPRWSASDMAEGLSATSPRASTPSPPGVLAAA
jgi:hypothetical protein